ncbi:hypothetical protein E2C01_030122 [Portunus trituberculatus]|uniref:Uncharacterized protein n=1 Tax=Portunus trituberculatus TaxID=210409 RepID=A0A5B7ETD5_PORTR|nr:hypothetical protein [Portunus trituberculatus]
MSLCGRVSSLTSPASPHASCRPHAKARQRLLTNCDALSGSKFAPHESCHPSATECRSGSNGSKGGNHRPGQGILNSARQCRSRRPTHFSHPHLRPPASAYTRLTSTGQGNLGDELAKCASHSSAACRASTNLPTLS